LLFKLYSNSTKHQFWTEKIKRLGTYQIKFLALYLNDGNICHMEQRNCNKISIKFSPMGLCFLGIGWFLDNISKCEVRCIITQEKCLFVRALEVEDFQSTKIPSFLQGAITLHICSTNTKHKDLVFNYKVKYHSQTV
jgi:hypothetical protein